MSKRVSAGLTLLIVATLSAPLPGVGPASAHSSLASARPASNQALDGPPSVVALTFTSEIQTDPATTTVVIQDQDDRDWADGAVQVTATGVDQAIDPALPDGRYQVLWSVVSADGAPLDGSYRFTVGDVPPESNPLNVPLTEGRSDWFRGVAYALVGALLVLTAYTLWATYRRKPRSAASARPGVPLRNRPAVGRLVESQHGRDIR